MRLLVGMLVFFMYGAWMGFGFVVGKWAGEALRRKYVRN